jgi:predicted nucleotidyltransferase
MCTQTQLDKITNEITKSIISVLGDSLHNVILFGSYARGDYDAESDVDILVLADIENDEMGKL